MLSPASGFQNAKQKHDTTPIRTTWRALGCGWKSSPVRRERFVCDAEHALQSRVFGNGRRLLFVAGVHTERRRSHLNPDIAVCVKARDSQWHSSLFSEILLAVGVRVENQVHFNHVVFQFFSFLPFFRSHTYHII